MIAELAAGSLARAVGLLDEKQLDRRRWLLETVAEIHRSRVADLVAAAKAWKGENVDFKEDLEWLKLWIRDLLVQQLESTDKIGLLNSDYSEKIMSLAPLLRPEHLLEMFDLVSTVQAAISYNINKRLGLEALLLMIHARATGRIIASESMIPASGKRLVSPAGKYYG
jgi:DNA polymerase III gamma/tau subunit